MSYYIPSKAGERVYARQRKEQRKISSGTVNFWVVGLSMVGGISFYKIVEFIL
jgi:hypothetical protein